MSKTSKVVQGKAPKSMGRVITAVAIGGTLEAFDFILYGAAAATVFNVLYFKEVKSDPSWGQMLAYATFAIGFLIRPFGAVALGHLGDRRGRRLVLLLTMVLMGAGTLGIALLPTYASIGIWAPIGLIILRLSQGVAYSGEFGAMATTALEHAPPGTRAKYSALVTLSSPIGVVLATGALAAASMLSGPDFLVWGWRMPFFLGAVAALFALYVRRTLDETPEFMALVEAGKRQRVPIVNVVSKVPGTLLLGTMLSAGTNAIIYLFAVFIISYGVNNLQATANQMLWAVTIGFAANIPVTMYLAARADRTGAHRQLIWAAIGLVVASLPMFWLLRSGSYIGIVAALTVMLCLVQVVFQSLPVVLFGGFDTDVRYSGGSLSYQLGATIGGGMTPLLVTSLLRDYPGNPSIPAIYCLGAAMLILVSGIALAYKARGLVDTGAARPAGVNA
jgi:MFS family permease